MKKEQLKKLLLQQKSELRSRIGKIYKEIKHRDMSHQSHQQVIERFNDDVLGGLEHEAEVELIETERALHRLAEDTFGHCLECGEAINDDRLRLLPHTELCSECAALKEEGHLTTKTHF